MSSFPLALSHSVAHEAPGGRRELIPPTLHALTCSSRVWPASPVSPCRSLFIVLIPQRAPWPGCGWFQRCPIEPIQHYKSTPTKGSQRTTIIHIRKKVKENPISFTAKCYMGATALGSPVWGPERGTGGGHWVGCRRAGNAATPGTERKPQNTMLHTAAGRLGTRTPANLLQTLLASENFPAVFWQGGFEQPRWEHCSDHGPG